MATAQRRPHQRELLAAPLMAAVGLNSVGVICRWKWLSSVHQHTPYLAGWLRLVSPVWRFNSHTGSYYLSTSCLIIKTILWLLYFPLEQLRLTSLRCLCQIFCLFSTKAFPQQSCTQASGPIGGISSPRAFFFFPFDHILTFPHQLVQIKAVIYVLFSTARLVENKKKGRLRGVKAVKTPLSHFCCVIHSAALTPGTEAEMNLTETPSLLNSPPRPASSRTSRTPGVVPADYRMPVSQSPLQPPSTVLTLQNLFTNNKDGAHCWEIPNRCCLCVCVCGWVGAHEPLERNSCKTISFVAGGRAWRRPARCRRPCGLRTWQPPPL